MLDSKEARAQARAKADEIERQFQRSATRGDLVADWVAERVGSWNFIGYQSVMLGIWIIWNSISVTAPWHFDPPPFIGLNLLLSFQAAYTAPFIMMSQNRSQAKDRAYAESDYETNALAGTEIEEMHDHLNELIEGAQLRPIMLQHLETLLDRLTNLEAQNAKLMEAVAEIRTGKQKSGEG